MSGAKGNIGFDHVGIGTAISHNRLTVPPNQRNYSWEDKHVLALFQDLSKAIEANKSAYFLGTIVLTHAKKGGGLEVADGQQRLATSTILLASIRDYLHQRKDEILVNSIENDFLFTTVRETRQISPRLGLNSIDHGFFEKRILSRPDSKDRDVQPQKESHERIQRAAELAAQHIKNIVSPHAEKNRIEVLNRWVKFLEESAQVIMLRVPDDMNAYVMFETLNDRGLRTSQADLLKNYLFSQADEREADAQQKWSSMVACVEALGMDDIVMTYLRHVTISLFGHTIERDVYEKIRDKTAGQGPALSFLETLEGAANDYVAILTASHAKWNNYHGNIRKSVHALSELRSTPLRPLMLAVARKFSPKEAELAFRMFVRWTVRFLISGGMRSGVTEESYAECAQKVTQGEITTAKLLLQAMRATLPSDKEFEAAFAVARVSQNYLARYYLRSLEMKVKGASEPEWIPNDDVVINLEHILPENPDQNWPDIDPETAAAYYKRVGNLVLLQATKNSLIGNGMFSDKRSVLKSSAYELTKEAGKASKWGPKEINARQHRLAKLAVETWPLTV